MGTRIARLLSFALILCSFAAASAASAADRQASLVIDGNTGHVLHSQASDAPRYPASLTKLMTLYIVFELMEQGRLTPTTRIKISDEAAATPPSKLGLAAGSDIALMDAVRILITKSANDLAVAIAEHVAGTEAKFAALMTKKAHQLGMAATTFANPHGLPDSRQITTARDMATLALRLNDDFPKYYKLFSLREFSYGNHTFRNHNTMLTWYNGMDGLKTGYTTSSGFNLVASVRRNGRYVVGVVFGGSTAGARNVYMRAILDRSIIKASTEVTRKPLVLARAERAPRTAELRKSDWTPTLVEPVRPVTAPPKPRVIAEAVQPAAKTPPQASPVSTIAPQPKPVTAREILADDAPRPAEIQIAKVRPVVVAPRLRLVAQAPGEGDTQRTTDVPPAPAAGPLPSPQPMAATGTAPSPRIGTPPSSLQSQAERLTATPPALPPPAQPTRMAAATAPTVSPAFHLKGPTPLPVSAGDVSVQIGAYATEAEAGKQLASVLAKVGTLPPAARPITVPVLAGGRQLFRARFAGLDAQSAAGLCIEMRRQQIDCHVARGN